MALDQLLAPNFWVAANDPRRVYRADSVLFMVLPISARMQVILRTEKEFFTATVMKAFQAMPFTCAINAIQYSVTASGVAGALFGQAVDPSDTTPDGLLVSQGRVIGGRSAPRMFYVVNNVVGGYDFGAGDPPSAAACGAGGVGPIIINGLPYGVGNRCRLPANCPATGPIPAGSVVEQRNNSTYEAQEHRGAPVGKTIIATNKDAGRLLVMVQPNGASGLTFDQIKGALLGSGCDNAIFFDGSDSAMLNVRGTFEVRPAPRKDATNTVGLAFYI